jgi:hypothetical protein
MRRLGWTLLLASLVVIGCGSKTNGGGGGGGDGGSNHNGPDACSGLGCQITNCTAMNMPPTSISGTVWAPNGTLPLDEVNVYIPNSTSPLPAFTSGVQCQTCSEPLPGNPIVTVTSGATGSAGSFTLNNIPDGTDIPVVITIGKWRRQLKIANVAKCTNTPLATADTSLPKGADDMSPNTTGVDLPNIAISTGEADALECLVRKLGIEDKEISTANQAGHIHLYADTGAGQNEGADKFASGFAGGTGNFADSQASLWGGTTGSGDLSLYDIVIFSCEGDQVESTKSQNAMNNVEAYADNGGRIFMSHWHNIWIEGSTEDGTGNQKPTEWVNMATFNDNGQDPGGSVIDNIDTNADDNPKGQLFANWMQDPGVMGSTTLGDIALQPQSAKQTATGVNGSAGTERWVNLDPTGADFPQMFQFNTPVSATADAQCGKVVFSDMHVSGGTGESTSSPGTAYPGGCSTQPLDAQEKALAFMFFDISTCAGTIL